MRSNGKKLRLLTSFDKVIEILGGSTAVGEMIGKNSSHVCNWRRERGTIPPKYYLLFRRKLEPLGYVPSDRLFGFAEVKQVVERHMRVVAG